MKKRIMVEGLSYRLRPVSIDDAGFIIDVRLEDEKRNRYINPISRDVDLQQSWIESYLERDDDYYFVVENIFTGKPEGLISVYDIKNGEAEWGRWVLTKTSLAAIESVNLIYKVAFEKLNLKKLYCRTISDNRAVVDFHNNLPQKCNGEILNHVEIGECKYDVIEHYVDADYYYNELQVSLEKKIEIVYSRNLKSLTSKLDFHHIGVATRSIEQELKTYRFLGYKEESDVFVDHNQGIRGLFIASKDQPRLELLENLDGSKTLDKWIDSGVKNYHFAYLVDDIERTIKDLERMRCKIISPLKESVYFGKRICFLVLPNRFMIELIEK